MPACNPISSSIQGEAARENWTTRQSLLKRNKICSTRVGPLGTLPAAQWHVGSGGLNGGDPGGWVEIIREVDEAEASLG